MELAPGVLADCDVVVVLVYGLYGENAERMNLVEQFRADPIWAQVPAVARGDVAYVDSEAALASWGVGGVEVVQEQLTEQLRS